VHVSNRTRDGVYTIADGLAAVVVTESLSTIILLTGAIAIT